MHSGFSNIWISKQSDELDRIVCFFKSYMYLELLKYPDKEVQIMKRVDCVDAQDGQCCCCSHNVLMMCLMCCDIFAWV